jgi:hypothetical protein
MKRDLAFLVETSINMVVLDRGMEMELWLDTDSDLDPLRKDPRFIALFQTIKDERGSRLRTTS